LVVLLLSFKLGIDRIYPYVTCYITPPTAEMNHIFKLSGNTLKIDQEENALQIIPNVSRFTRRKDKVLLNNNVTLIMM